MSSSLPSRSMCLTATDWPVRLSRARYTIPKEPPKRVLLEVVQSRVEAELSEPTAQLLQHVIVVRRHFVWYFLLRRSVSTRTTVPYSVDPCSSPRAAGNPVDGDNNKHNRRPHTTRASNKKKRSTQGSMEESSSLVQYQQQRGGRVCDGWQVGCLNIGRRCLVRISTGQCPAACPSSAGSSARMDDRCAACLP